MCRFQMTRSVYCVRRLLFENDLNRKPFALSQFHFFSSSPPDDLNNSNSPGASSYANYLQIKERIHQLQEQEEKRKSEAMYRAWEQAQNPQGKNNNSSETKTSPRAGVAVIKTLAKQTRSAATAADADLSKLRESMQDALVEAAHTYQYPPALVQLGNQLVSSLSRDVNDDTKDSVKQAEDSFRKACELGSAEGCFNLGNLLWNGWPPRDSNEDDRDRPPALHVLPPNHKEALGAFQKAIDLNDANAMYFYGVLLLGDANSDTARQGLAYVESAAESGHSGALYYLALLHLNGNELAGVPPCAEEEFTKRLNDAVEAGEAEALFLRGHSQFHGENGYSMDYRGALKDFLDASSKGHADASISAGAMLHGGNYPGIEQDQRQAFQLYQYAGELGSKEGWRNVVSCYLTGEGIPQSHQMAKYIAETMLK